MSVKALKEFRIPYLGLKLGHHQYQFTLDSAFFDKFELSEIHTGTINVRAELEKQSTMLIFTFELEGTVDTTCDRCGDDMIVPVSNSQRVIVKFGEETGTTDDDILVLGPAEHEVDISQFLYEYAQLALPFRHVHPDIADCNQDAMKVLQQYRVESASSSQWAELKNLNYEDPEDKEFIDDDEEE